MSRSRSAPTKTAPIQPPVEVIAPKPKGEPNGGPDTGQKPGATNAAGKRKTREDGRWIRVRGAKEHNLKNIDVAIPRDQLVVITGLSGSGKSSLAFDTIFAEGQRKYMESLSAYARQFLEQLKKPDVEEIEGIPPTIAIEQRSASSNPRSTVATTTEIYDYLRLLFARCGTPVSWAPTKLKKDGSVLERAGTPITAMSATQIVDKVMSWPEGSRLMVLAPVIRAQKGFHHDVLEDFQHKGWQRARVNGKIVDLREVLKEQGENPLKLERYVKHTIDAVIDRIVLKADGRQRLAESIEAALKLADGAVIVSKEVGEGVQASWTDHPFSEKFADPERPEFSLAELSPRLFSFNSPFGACPVCHGLGTLLELDEATVIPDEALSLSDNAIKAYTKNVAVRHYFHKALRRFCKDYDIPYNLPLNQLSKEQRKTLLFGTPEAKGKRPAWTGVIPQLTKWWETTDNSSVKEWLGGFLTNKPCTGCFGDRLKIEALHVLLTSSHRADMERGRSGSVIGRSKSDGAILNIAELSRLTITDALAYVEGLKLSREHAHIAEPILKEVGNRLRFLMSVGLEYLSLDRRTATLSGGEAQRIRLATQVGSGLVGACYVLDEPTIGLHQRDNARLIKTLRHLTDIGNSVLVVEHDEDMIRAADYVLDIGPGPGIHGGRVVAQGSVADICRVKESLTGAYLSGRRQIDVPTSRRTLSEKNAIVIKGAAEHNLKGIDAVFPLGGLICITGVSGSGKSTLVNDILLKAALRHLLGRRESPGAHDKITGLNRIDRIIEVDQSPIGRTPRSNPATYTGFFDDIRKVFAATKEAKIRGYEPGRFSFNVKGGRCEACQGQGVKKIEMHFLPDVYVQCEVCEGTRYNRETLQVTYRGKSIAEVLKMTVEEALGFWENHTLIRRFVQCLHEVGLDYIEIGQPSTQLSGGEAQRIKLATELGKSGGTKNMPVQDVPLEEIKKVAVRMRGAAANNGDETPRKHAAAIRSSPYGHTLYVLDEPTTGLHFEDIKKLVSVFDRLAEGGNTLVVIEHNLDVIKRADWIIDLGPEGGDGGGRIVATGTPEQVAKVEKSYTGQYLKQVLAR